MRELTSIEMNAVGGGIDAEHQEPSLQSQFWGSFMYSSGFASGIFWSPVMPFVMGTTALISILANGLVSLVTATGNGAYYVAAGAASLIRNTESN